jgi:integrase/recombinase XerD
MSTPLITIFVRHSPGCKYAGDEFCKRCDCKKHFRWTLNGKQYRKAADTRSWAEADRTKRNLEDQLAGRAPETVKPEVQTIRAAMETLLESKKVKGITVDGIRQYRLQIGRFVDWCEKRNAFTFSALTYQLLVSFQATFADTYESTYTQSQAQKRLRGFLHFCHDAGWLEKVPKMESIKVVEPPTLPLTPEEYERLLAAVPLEIKKPSVRVRVRGVIQLMRWSGLAVRDAVTLSTGQLLENTKREYHILGTRQKTGVHVFVPIPDAIAHEILAVPLASPGYYFWKRTCTAESAAQNMSLYISRVFTRAKVFSDGNMVSHRLRDTFAVDLLEKGVPLDEVSKLLGHESIITTEKHYAKWVKGRQERLTNLVRATWVTG